MSPRTFRLLTHSWGVGVGLLALFACLTFFLLPDQLGGNPAVEAKLHGWDDAYYAVYGVAGVSILAGLLRRRAYLEAFGLCLFVTGLCVNLAALVGVFGPAALAHAGGSWLAYVVGALGRLAVVARFVRERVTLEDIEGRGP